MSSRSCDGEHQQVDPEHQTQELVHVLQDRLVGLLRSLQGLQEVASLFYAVGLHKHKGHGVHVADVQAKGKTFCRKSWVLLRTSGIFVRKCSRLIGLGQGELGSAFLSLLLGLALGRCVVSVVDEFDLAIAQAVSQQLSRPSFGQAIRVLSLRRHPAESAIESAQSLLQD